MTSKDSQQERSMMAGYQEVKDWKVGRGWKGIKKSQSINIHYRDRVKEG